MKLRPTLKEKRLDQTTARDFSGGLNLTDSEFNLTSKFAVAGYNMVPDDNGALQVRWGTRLFADITSVLTKRIVAVEYYYQYIIAVDAGGLIAATDGSGVVKLIWSPPIARKLPGSPDGWNATVFASFTQFTGDLIVANGTDKPIVIDNTLTVQYLQDLGSGSNINVPVCKFVKTMSNYTVMAGDVNSPGRLYISNAGTSGTWPGDALPNDAITFDVDKYAPDAFGEITALASYRELLVVFFSQCVVTIRLGAYSTATPPVHTPKVEDIIASYGAVSHNAIVNIGDSLVFMDPTGVSSIKQTVFTTSVTPERIATLIDVDIQRTLSRLSRSFLQRRCFALYNRADSRILFFAPTDEDDDVDQEMRVYALTLSRGKPGAWNIFKDWNFQAGCITTEGRVFFANDRRVLRYGSRYEPILSDYEGIRSYDGLPSDKVSTNVYGVFCDASTLAAGIKFYHELPYNGLQDRTAWKSFHYMTLDTQGSSPFTVSFYLNDLRKRTADTGEVFSDGTLFSDGFGWLPLTYAPDTAVSFIGGDRGADQVVLPAQVTPYRPTDNMQLYAVYGRFRLFKMTVSGVSHAHLRVVSVSLYHTKGSIY